MATYTINYFSEDDAAQIANSVKDAVVRQLQVDGIVPSDCTWASQHAIVLVKPGIWGELLDKVLFRDPTERDRRRIAIVRIANV